MACDSDEARGLPSKIRCDAYLLPQLGSFVLTVLTGRDTTDASTRNAGIAIEIGMRV